MKKKNNFLPEPILVCKIHKRDFWAWRCQKIYSDDDDTCMCQFPCFLHKLKYFELIHHTKEVAERFVLCSQVKFNNSADKGVANRCVTSIEYWKALFRDHELASGGVWISTYDCQYQSIKKVLISTDDWLSVFYTK